MTETVRIWKPSGVKHTTTRVPGVVSYIYEVERSPSSASTYKAKKLETRANEDEVRLVIMTMVPRVDLVFPSMLLFK
jgi:hypothetical protein